MNQYVLNKISSNNEQSLDNNLGADMERVSENLDYIPLNRETIKTGMSFGPIEFRIKPESHKHHLDYLKRENSGSLYDFTKNFLFPFEMFSLPRVLSTTYKRLNEVLSTQCEKYLYKLPKPDESLFAEVKVNSVFERHGLCFGFFTSHTYAENRDLLMMSMDKVLLINGSNINSVRKTIKNEKHLSINSFPNAEFIGEFILRFRHKWEEAIWINNIHTDRYANYVGFERGLIEAPAFVDVLLSNKKVGFLLREGINIKWQYYKPLYRDLKVSLALAKNESATKLLLYETDSSYIVLKVTVKDL
jgi:hypothetical protein